MEIEYEPRFLDEVVRRAIGARPEARLYHRERERAYDEPDPEERGRAFEALDRSWYARLELEQVLRAALDEQPLVRQGVGRIAVGRPLRRQDTGAELLVRPPEAGAPTSSGRLLRLLIAPETFLADEHVLTFLRRELLHVADMLDPAFGYEPTLPATTAGPTHQRLLRDRYRVVWDVVVDGRLVRAGHLPAETRTQRTGEFAAAFPGLDDADAAATFDRFFDDPAPTHAAIVEFVTRPAARGNPMAGTCALCGFPSADPDPDPDGLLDAAGGELARDFPDWRPADGCCRQCGDLYRSAVLSRAAAAALPGIR